MELILTEDIENLGEMGEVIEVADGYGRNYLVPKGLAVEPTVGNRRRYEKVRREISKKKEERRKHARDIADKLDGLTLSFVRKAQEEHHLYGSVRTGDIVESVKDETEIDLDEASVRLDGPIEELGQFGVEIGLYEDIHANIKVNVMEEEEEETEEEAEEKETE
ncbi:50S ribosomal protein L9 [Candidatus Bipolaricaulota bacterium]|nr:50S ribosomal protein L9 [Candidatus Bipolaricaulota bacterium]